MRDTTRPGIFGDLGVRLLILVLASCLLFAMQRSGQFQGIRAVLTRVVSPVQWRMMVETSRFADSLGEARRNRTALAEAGALAAANEILSAENAVLREALAENKRLREQLAYGTANPRFTFQGAHVIGRVLGFDPQDAYGPGPVVVGPEEFGQRPTAKQSGERTDRGGGRRRLGNGLHYGRRSHCPARIGRNLPLGWDAAPRHSDRDCPGACAGQRNLCNACGHRTGC